jgi:predicted metal-dependent enzyme (double-stranded beta helix superfamily)
MQETAPVAGFMARARELLRGGPTVENLHAVGGLLAEASAKPGFIPDVEMRSLHGGGSSFTILETNPDGLTLMLASFSPSEETPVHDHGSWGVACVVKGTDRYRHWRIMEDGELAVVYDKKLGPGSFVTWPDPPDDIHSQQGIDEPAIELVLFGKDVTRIRRTYYDTLTGTVRTALPH